MSAGEEAQGGEQGTRLIADWTYTPSAPSWRVRVRRWQARLLARRAPPRHRILVAPVPAPRWNILFLYLPAGDLDADQREILARVRALDGRLLVVFAAPEPAPPAALRIADALVWKDLPGFDLSAQAIALDAIARHAPGATVYAQNDSVLGPFADIDAAVARARWDLTGFIASAAVENHLSAFAFICKEVTTARVAALAPALSTQWRYDDFDAVVRCQETRLARVAARSMTVGAFLYTPDMPAIRPLTTGRRVDIGGDPTLAVPLALLDRGFPFVKRSLFGKFAAVADSPALLARLSALGWPTSP